MKLDYNNLTGVFLERYTKKLVLLGYTPEVSHLGLTISESNSVLASDSEELT